ncbi:MAG: outer membrane protein transport protein, partial [Acidobacteriota bacterium]|nr:outer membrane protein transport protein [Acidobacteriota bacterium]
GLSGLSFFSFVYPAGNWSVAFYRHQLASYEFFGEMDSLFAGPWPGFPDSKARSWDLLKSTNLDLTGTGVSAAYRVSDSLSVGLGVSYFEGAVSTLSETFGFDDPADPDDFWSFETLFAPQFLVESSLIYADDTDVAFLAGVLWRWSDRWTLGAVFRQGPEMEGISEVRGGPMNRDSVPAGALIEFGAGRIPFPDVFGVGASFRSRGQRLTIGIEWDRVEYSSILVSAPEYSLSDANELHVGLEYVYPKSTPVVALRVGAWLDPEHRVRYGGIDYVARAVLQPGSDELHLAVGFGVAFARFQIDVGVDRSDLVDTASVSAIYSF